MLLDGSSDCECPNCSEDTQSKSDWNPCSIKSGNDSLYSRSRRKSMLSSHMQSFPSQCCSTSAEGDTKEEIFVFPQSEEESYTESSQSNSLRQSPEDIIRKTRPLGELTIQELLRQFGDSRKFHPNSMSVGHFKDLVVMKFRRALYHSGIWVTHVQGYRMEKHFSANYFKRNPGCLRRLVPWLKRELTAVYGDYGYTVKNILATILHHMTEHDLDSDSFIHFLEPYLQQHTHHFLHEFISFVHSPYDMETYDQRAIYQCPASSPWEKKSVPPAPALPLPEDQALLVSHHDTRQANNTQSHWNNEEKALSGLKQFPNGNSSLKKSDISPVHHKLESKMHACIKDKPESGSHKGTISTKWAAPRERGPGLLNSKKHVQERKTEGIKVLPDHVQDLGKNETIPRPISTPAIFNQGPPRKGSLKEGRVLSPNQQINFQKKEVGKKKHSDSLPKIFQRRLPRGRSLITCKSRKRDPSWSCISEVALSPKRGGGKLHSFRKRKMKCRQSSQFAKVSSYPSQRNKQRSKSNTHRSNSWFTGPRKRSTSRESSSPSLKGSLRSECFTQNMCCGPSQEKNVHDYESNPRRASSMTVQYPRLSSTAGETPKCPSKGEGASQSRNHCNSPTCLQIERHIFPNKQEMNQRVTFPRARKSRAVGKRKSKYQCPDKQTTEETSSEVRDQDDIKQMSSLLSVYLPAGGKYKRNRRIYALRNITGPRMNTKEMQNQKHRGASHFERQISLPN
ncbi:LOW QUALITY PROTEIN: E3 ubiquitin-protein ligase Topors-like [Choloepus didactylus]|uniref:LOW QUALITY PROTEIN: E3 ubiquitin-protein ligase Topors-like n=1 Tax=Choloepus didactylus TaxID=27675 RepID=UPI00189E70F4|nr:LOW QUALITY PROTEIN: E3 ubiquitin-protein ligase Topors-like [Choloepus didactylus]